MNPTIQRFLPPAIVFGAALYFGWPPTSPLDLGDELVKAKAVRWKKDDLIQPPAVTVEKDPFLPVLVAEEVAEPEVEVEVEQVVVAPEPVGPSPETIQNGLTLTGIATMAGRPWAIINGRPRLPGDVVRTKGDPSLSCEIISVNGDHAVVSCQKTLAMIRPVPAGSQRDAPTQTSAIAPETAPDGLPAEAAAPPAAPPPLQK